MIGDRSGYPLHFYGGNFGNSEYGRSNDLERVAQRFQNHLIAPALLHELPPDIDNFVGRSTEIQRVLSYVHQGVHNNTSGSIVVAITGRAGIGKSTLAIHLAHRLRSSFLDAQFYVNWRGTEPYTQHPTEIATRLLRAQGIDEKSIPIDKTERLEFFQSSLKQKHIILVLDNVENSTQLNSLLPQNAAGIVFVTSRQPLTTPEGAIELKLTELPELEAVELLHKLVNQDTIPLTLKTAKEIVQSCHYLPLALRLIASVVNQRSSPIDYIEQLRSERERIEPLRLSHAEIRPSFMLNYQQLDPETAKLLRLLGLLAESHFTLPVAAELLQVGSDQAGQRVGQLVDRKLVKRMGGGHYQMAHDIVRLLARGVLAAEESTEFRQAARLRVACWYLNTCQLMSLGLNVQVRRALAQVIVQTRRQPLTKIEQHLLSGTLSWFEIERLSILAAIEWAFQAEAWNTVIAFAESLVLFFELHTHWLDWEKTHRMALEAARQLENRQKTAELLNDLGNNHLRQHKTEQAQNYYNQSVAIFRELAQKEQAAKTIANLGVLNLQVKRPQAAAELWQEALTYLPAGSIQQQDLQQWMQLVNPTIGQHLNSKFQDNPASSGRGLFQSVGNAIKRLMSESPDRH